MLRVDKYGLVTAGDDNGDACQRTFSVLLLCHLLWLTRRRNTAYENAFNQITASNAFGRLETKPGIYVRHPAPGWESDFRTVSRDQLTPVICYLAVMCNTKATNHNKHIRAKLTDLLLACLKRGMFAQNSIENRYKPTDPEKRKLPDFINPDLWAIFASGYMATPWAPIATCFLLFGDIWSVFGAIMKVLSDKDPKDVDDTNMNNCIVARQYCFSTPFSWLARKIYKTFRRKNNGNKDLGETSAVMGAIALYNVNDNSDITELHRPLVDLY